MITVLPQFEFPKNLTCPSGKFRTEFTSSYWTLLFLQSLHGDVITMLLRYMVHTTKYYTVVQNLHCKETCVKSSKKGLAARFEITVIALKQKNTTDYFNKRYLLGNLFLSGCQVQEQDLSIWPPSHSNTKTGRIKQFTLYTQ